MSERRVNRESATLLFTRDFVHSRKFEYRLFARQRTIENWPKLCRLSAIATIRNLLPLASRRTRTSNIFARISHFQNPFSQHRLTPARSFPLAGIVSRCALVYRFSRERITETSVSLWRRTLVAIAEKFTVAPIDRHGEKEKERGEVAWREWRRA